MTDELLTEPQLPNESHSEKVSPRERTLQIARGLAHRMEHALKARGLAFYGKALTVLLCAYFLADIVAIFGERMVPEPVVVRGNFGNYSGAARRSSPDDFAAIWGRNLFNHLNLIPGDEEGGSADPGGVPVRTTLPFNLVGILVLKDERRSIATIEDKSVNQVFPVRLDDEIPSKARIIQVESHRVVFLNLGNNRREFVDLPDDPTPTFQVNRSAAASAPGIDKLGDGQYAISKDQKDKVLKDFNKVLTQARAVPNFENGLPAGYKFFQIEAGSIYDLMGMKDGDIISSINGKAVNDPAEAFQFLNQLKDGSLGQFDIGIKRNGVLKNNNYTIR
jgi:type II secretion system protein C